MPASRSSSWRSCSTALTEQLSQRLDPRRRARRGHGPTGAGVGIVAIACVAAWWSAWWSRSPRSSRTPSQSRSGARSTPSSTGSAATSSWLTERVQGRVSYDLLNPIQTVLTQSPFWLVIGGGRRADRCSLSGMRQAIVAVACLVAIFAHGLWQHSMETLVQVLVATVITFAHRPGPRHRSRAQRPVRAVLRPILDALQTMPSFVYLAARRSCCSTRAGSRPSSPRSSSRCPPVIRLVDVGIRAVPPRSSRPRRRPGATAGSCLVKVQLPVARPALLLAAQPGGHPRPLDGRGRRPGRRPGARLRRGRRLLAGDRCSGSGSRPASRWSCSGSCSTG